MFGFSSLPSLFILFHWMTDCTFLSISCLYARPQTRHVCCHFCGFRSFYVWDTFDRVKSIVYIYIYIRKHIFTFSLIRLSMSLFHHYHFFCGAVVVIVLHIHRYIGKSVTFLTKPVDISYSEEIYKKTGARFDKQRGRNGRMNQYW